MGTRYLLKIVFERKVWVAQYGHWDGDSAGSVIAAFLRMYNKRSFVARLKKVVLVSIDATNRDDMVDGVDGKKRALDGVEILDFIANHDKPRQLKLVDMTGYDEDNSDCEWSYTIDLDKEIVVVSIPGGKKVSWDTRLEGSVPFSEYCKGCFPEDLVGAFQMYVSEVASATYGVPQRYIDAVKRQREEERDEANEKKKIKVES